MSALPKPQEESKMKILSLGAGVQSSTLALMCEAGEIEKPDYAIFADTGWEPRHVYEWLDYIEKQISFPVLRVSKGNIKNDLIQNIEHGKRFGAIPFFTNGGGMGRRQCTNAYKLQPIRKKVRELLGFEKGQRIPSGSVDMYIGISVDEIQRMKPSRDKWINNVWPLIDLDMTRNDCFAWMRKHKYPQPPKSSCIGCPYHSNSHWAEMQKNDPESFADAVSVDNKLRDSGVRTGMKNEEFMHRSLIPLGDITFFDDRQQELDLFDDECEGMCGL